MSSSVKEQNTKNDGMNSSCGQYGKMSQMSRTKTLVLIREAFKESDGVVSDYIETPLICPYTLKRMTTPCRTFYCTHIRCFDASATESLHPDNNKICTVNLPQQWKCPICRKSVMSPRTIYVDAYFVEVLEKCKTDANIQIFPDGTWMSVKDIDKEGPDDDVVKINDSVIDLTNDSVLDSTIIDLTELDITLNESNTE